MTSRANHLTEAEFVDLLEGTLDASRRQHADSCEQCAAQAADLVSSAEAAGGDDVPEPPPFFWTQFSARVSEAVTTEAARPRLGSLAWARASWMGAAAAVAVAIVWMFLARNPGETAGPANPAVEIAAAHPDAVPGDDLPDLDADEAWALVRSIAADLDEDQMDAEGVSPGAGAAERLSQQLTDAERTELARLLEEQLRQSGARESAS
jgi:hypothetical protein